jgi:23S rRNA-/tRNA-specific pseudouridylate synthase
MKTIKFHRIKTKKKHRLIDVISSYGFSKKKAKKIIDEGLVSVSGIKETFYRKSIKTGSIVEFCFNNFLFKREFKILFEENGVYVIAKPPFINSNKDKPNLEDFISHKLKKELKVVHRLDKQTTGAIIAVERKELFEFFKEAFKKGSVGKEYLAVTYGIPKRKKFKINLPLNGKKATSEVEVVEEFKGGTLCRIKIHTGRTHQIRRHLSAVGYPIAGEFKYWKSYKFPFTLSPRIMLHSYKVSFLLPDTGKKVSVKAPLPTDFKEFLTALKEENFPLTVQEI